LNVLEGPFHTDDETNVHVVQPMAAVKKKNSERMRVITDYLVSGCNKCLPDMPFGLPTVGDALRLVRRAKLRTGVCFGAKVDLTDGFFHTSTAPADRKFHCVLDPTPTGWRPPAGHEEADGAGVFDHTTATGRVWRYRATPFGNKLSPFYFCQPVEYLCRFLRETFGLGILAFVDDIVAIADSREASEAAIAAIRDCFDYLGMTEAKRKYESPSEVFTWLGLEVDTRDEHLTVRYPDDKKTKLLARMAEFEAKYSQDGAKVPRKVLAELVGRFAFAANGVRYGKVYLRRLYDALHRNVDHLSYTQRRDMHGSTTLDGSWWDDWRWWQEHLPRAPGVRFWIDRSTRFHRIFGDASKAGRGANFYSETGVQRFSLPWPPEMRAASSNLRELTVLADCIREWGDQFRPGDRVFYSTDNKTTAATINSGGNASEQLDEVARYIHGWAADHDVFFLARWVPGKAIIKEGSDGLSREDRFAAPLEVDWRLAPAVDEHWTAVCGYPPLLPRHDDVGDVLRDALDARAAGDTVDTTVVVPDWPSASWWPRLAKCEVLYRYKAGAHLLAHPRDEGRTCQTTHPTWVVRVASGPSRPLSRCQRRQSATCVFQ
jgi:hypothetical protein